VIIFCLLFYLLLIIFFINFIFLNNNNLIIISLKIFKVNFFSDLELVFNIWNIIFIIIVLFIRLSVIIFSVSYINNIWVRNFIFLYCSFIIRIIWLILNNNFYWIIFGWDGLGVVSFLLIIFYINYESINNGLFTLFQNRLGDLFFVLFLLIILDTCISNNNVIKFMLVFLLLGSCVKRAQFPFNSWLLAAIRAPTPISSLVHSSTLVVAGVYILLQFSYCMYDWLVLLKYLSLITLFIRRFGLINERDIKKLIAYSTINHVALILYLYRFKLYKIVYFHLNIHAIFKSLIFICFGFVILRSFHAQDKRLISLNNLNPIIKSIYYYSCMCLAGLPFLRGFFSKDLIIEKIIRESIEISFLLFLILFLRIRIFYSIKLIILSNIIFSYTMVEKNYLSIFSLVIIILLIIIIINVYLSLVFRLTLELFSFKIIIYLWIIWFFFLRLFLNLNFKLESYDYSKNFKEIWVFDYYHLEKFVYWHIFIFLQYLRLLSNIKLLLLINWWVIIIFLILF